MLQISDLTYRIGDRLLIDKASVTLPAKAKTGLVGRNGAGKSTLFKIITGDLSSETGSVQIPKRARIGQVAQEAPGTEQTLMEVVLAADTERTRLLGEAETETDPDRIAEIHTRLADIGAHTAEARAGAILSGLGFDAAAQQRPCSAFSGGWRMRVALAAVLFSEPDLLLLDEPTNYLDLEGTLWLENYVARYPHQVLLISHDRDLLNKAVDSIVHLDRGKMTYYSGGYDSFDRQRREAMILAEKAKEKQDVQRKHMQAFVDRFRYKASKARQAQARLKMLERMEPIAALTEESSKPIHFPDPEGRLAPPIIKLEGVSTGYGDTKILSRLTLNIDTDDRIALLGANGNGKSTFAKLISNRLVAMDGEITKATKLKIAFFAQHQLDELRPEESAVAHVRALMPDAPEAKVRARVARFGLPTDRQETPAKDLSGGEKARLLLGLATFDGPHLLILDEPTNHLDIDSREALVMALNDYQGAVVLISHDRHLVEACADRLWLVADGKVEPYDGDMEDYKRLILQGPEAAQKARDKAAAAEADAASAQEKRREAAQKRSQLKPLRQKIDAAEKEMTRLQQKIAKIDDMLADPEFFQTDPNRAAKFAKERAFCEKKLVKTEEEWLELSAEFEEAG
ncbi:ABC-F family ATP-binding cassette domain-containing protein [Roseibium alexandrii]|uniref:ATPase component of ABC transporter with duplicated ATPase domain protein n=1 Tax=Roseibium alexandrii (strain DSM 17067 / NCIMB 14079 / DFL-11) TaxID=244592 RepID=A0A5E8H304_ROSAD|nr:ABC-F family ATP-binding cassette domain-containing protein [Roseibium alexandrii]EEE45686.1 ATPase component of ABC transporter with duplicated ATPase domain protein [Roseibium alexandrii DFL-11]